METPLLRRYMVVISIVFVAMRLYSELVGSVDKSRLAYVRVLPTSGEGARYAVRDRD